MEKRTKDLLIIMPAYNEEACIGRFLEQMEAPEISGIADILVINDGSSDETSRIARQFGCEVIDHIYNIGYTAALLSGYKYALRRNYKYVIQIDSDRQHDPCNIIPIYDRLRSFENSGRAPDIVLGSRFLEGGKSFPMSWLKKTAISAFRMLVRVTTGKKITDPTTGLQGLNVRAMRYYTEYSHFDDMFPDANVVIQMILLGYQVEEVPAVMHSRQTGKDMYRGLIKQGRYMIHMLFSICAVLLRVLVLKTEGHQ